MFYQGLLPQSEEQHKKLLWLLPKCWKLGVSKPGDENHQVDITQLYSHKSWDMA